MDEDPATIPDPAEVEVPEHLRAEIEALMARYPERHSATLPALAAAQRVHGWCSPDAMRQVAAVMQVTPALSIQHRDVLRHAAHRAHRARATCTSAPAWPATCATPSRSTTRWWNEAAEQGLEDVELREFECLGACDMAPMASVDGRYVGPLTTDDAAEMVSAIKEGREVLPGRSLEDPGYELPPATGQPPGPPEEPDVHPAGGTWKDAALLDVPDAEGPPPHGRPTLHPLDPGTSVTPEEEPE